MLKLFILLFTIQVSPSTPPAMPPPDSHTVSFTSSDETIYKGVMYKILFGDFYTTEPGTEAWLIPKGTECFLDPPSPPSELQ